MRSIPSAVQTQRDTRSGTITHFLIWITGKNRSTGAAESVGIWTGDTTRSFTVGGASRSYVAAGSVLDISPIRFAVGMNVIYHDITLSPFTSIVQSAVRQYEPRLASVEIHQAAYDPETMQLLSAPFQIVDGQINEIEETLPEAGGEGSLTVAIASAARRFTVSPSLFKSDSAMKARSATDTFRAYVDVQGKIKTFWGDKKPGQQSGGGGGAFPFPGENL